MRRKVLEGAEGPLGVSRKIQQECGDGRDELETDDHKGYLSPPGCEITELQILVEL